VKKSKYLLKRFIFLLLFLFSLYLIEGACFRLIDDYANWRLYIAWGEPDDPKENKFLKKLPLDHFSECPTDRPKPNHLGYWISEELDYSRKTLSFTRPLRDHYKEFVTYNSNPLGNFSKRNNSKADITELLLPNLNKFATANDVNAELARRVGDKIETAKAVFIKVVIKQDAYTRENEFKRLNSSFGFLARQGFACLVLPVSSPEGLVDNIMRFKKFEPELSTNLFAWGEGKAATFLMKSCHLKPDLWNAIFLTTAEEYISPPNSQILPWVFFEVSEEQKFDEQGLPFIYDWIKSVRGGRNIFINRFSGFIKLVDLVGSTKAIPSTFISYAINAQKFTNAIQPRSETVYNEATIANDNILETKNETLKDDRLHQEKLEVSDFQEFDTVNTKASFDCKIVREYREMNAGKPELLKVSNRDIIVKLGLKFEEMGENVLEQIRLQDPLFYRYYNSLLIIEESPLN
jgi:hypothetical protein